MARQRSFSVGPWTKGIVNSSRDYSLPKGACLDALNVDFSDDGAALSRSGFSGTAAVDNGHSLSNQGGKVMFCNGTALGVIAGVNPLIITTLRTGLNIRPVSYAERGGEVWWSNGEVSGRCNADNSDHPWVPPAPANIMAVYAGVGALPAGSYRVAITHAMSDGEESVASDIETFDLVSPGSIEITLPAATAGTDSFNVYCSRADGKIMQKYSTVSAAMGSVSITANPAGRQIRERAFLRPLPPGDAICFHGGRLLSLSGEFLFYSKPYDYGVYDPDQDYVALGAEGSIVASVESGVFVAADRTWFFSGTDIATSEQMEKLPFGAAAGTAFVHPVATSPVVGWYSDEGLALGSADGSVKMMQRDRGFIAPSAQSGAVWVRQRDGMAHAVVTLDSTAAYGKQVSSDFTAARVRYNDDSTTMSVNLANGATSRYGGWGFNSYATIDGDEYGCDGTGFSLLEGAADGAAEIDAVIHCGRVGFGSLQIKAPENVYLAGKSSAPLVVDIILPSETVYSYPARTFSQTPAVMRHDGMKGLINARQAWFLMAIRSQGGASMELSAVDVVVNESQRRI